MNELLFRKKVLACWQGKNIGGTLGGPFEGFPGINELSFYDPVPTASMPNDDLELQAMYVAALTKQNAPEINRQILGDIWQKHMNYHCDEYAVAMKNLSVGIRPPWSGSYDNAYTTGMGAAIRSELWACLAPGNPELAARYAYEDGCIDHDGDGIHAEVFFAVIESLAFVESDLKTLIAAGLRAIPAESMLAAGIRDTCTLWDASGDWRTVRDALFAKYANEFKTDVRINIPFTVLALLSGNGEFGKTVCNAANCGMDTDCTAATAGAIMGILAPDRIPQEWLKPIGPELVVRKTAITGLDFPATIEAFTDQVLALKQQLRPQVTVPLIPSPCWENFKIHVEYAICKNLHWYLLKLDHLNFQHLRCDAISGSLEVPSEFRGFGGQIILRFRFEIKEAGKYSLMFNSPTSNQVYLDPQTNELHDDCDMLFGRQRLFLDQERPDGHFACADRPIIFSPTPGGAPLNQYRRNLPLAAGLHTLLVALEPMSFEFRIYWGVGVCRGNRFLTDVFR